MGNAIRARGLLFAKPARRINATEASMPSSSAVFSRVLTMLPGTYALDISALMMEVIRPLTF